MGQIGIWQIVIIGLIVVLLFGRGKISELMGDVARGIRSFKKGLNEDDGEKAAHDPAQIVSESKPASPVDSKPQKTKTPT